MKFLSKVSEIMVGLFLLGLFSLLLVALSHIGNVNRLVSLTGVQPELQVTSVPNTDQATLTPAPTPSWTPGPPTPTRDPRVPTPFIPPPEPTGVVINESPTPFPTWTPLPVVPQQKRQGLWAENLIIGQSNPLAQELKDVFDVAWSPDGDQLAVSTWTGETVQDPQAGITELVTAIVLVNTASQKVITLSQGIMPHWSLDGKYIAYIARGQLGAPTVRIINVESKEIIEVAALKKGEPFPHLAWLSSHELAFYQSQPQVFDLNIRRQLPLLGTNLLQQVNLTAPLNLITAAPAQGIFAQGSAKQILLLHWKGGTANLIRSIDEGSDHHYWAMSPDGEHLAHVPWSGKHIKIVGVSDGRESIVLPSSARGSPFVGGWSPDSSSFFYVDSEGTKVVNRDGSGLRIMPNLVAMQPPVWSPHGDHIAWVGEGNHLFTATATEK